MRLYSRLWSSAARITTPTLVIPRGTHIIDFPINIGSMRVVSNRDFVVLPALPALHHNVLNLLISNLLKKLGFA
jgi:hypothetical protein